MCAAELSKNSFTIILPVYNGATHLGQQLESIAAQSDSDWQLLLSDDGSSDDSPKIIKDFAARHPDQVSLHSGPNSGLTAHVLELLNVVPEGSGPIALCDQDDIWLEDRLASDRALMANLCSAHPQKPVLLCRRSQLCDETGVPLGLSAPRPRPPSFGNALVQNIASGNTMVFNRDLLMSLQNMSDAARDCAYHDWWIYQIAAGIGGHIHHDTEPKILYRQHGSNLVGVPRGLRGILARAARLLSGVGSAESATHLAALERVRAHLTPAAQRQLTAFQSARKGSLFK
ncbi:glycosyltransferase, partial [Planktotalea sp.]|uniref:glycosyltransferase n=1 Tax=Planktotalea sp. TaxID=2029877 RepID=UPI0032991B56